MQATEQDDLAVEVVGLDGAGAAGQALLRRRAEPLVSRNRLDGDVLTLRFLGGLHLDACGSEHRFAFGLGTAVEVGREAIGDDGIEGVAEVREQLAVLGAHDRGIALAGEPRVAQIRGDRLGALVDACGVSADR